MYKLVVGCFIIWLLVLYLLLIVMIVIIVKNGYWIVKVGFCIWIVI